MEIIGYIAAILIGISLGLIGSGGSILTVPVLVYLFGISPTIATAYSLFIVGVTSVTGSLNYFKRGLVDIKTAIIFGLPSIIAVYVIRSFLLPTLPNQLFIIGNISISKDMGLMLLFAVLMVFASISMIRKEKATEIPNSTLSYNYPLILLEGMLVGTLTGLVGAGGGFLIIPALILLSKLPMKAAIGTSLVIIASKSLIGFLGESSMNQLDWTFLLTITVFAVTGSYIGLVLSKKIESDKLKPLFGFFVLIMGIYVIIKEIGLISF